MNHRDLSELVDYSYWARDRIVDAVSSLETSDFTKDLDSSFGSIRDTLVHMYSAEWVWYSRWAGISPAEHVSAAKYADVAALLADWSDLEHQVRVFVGNLADEDVEREISYTTFDGTVTRSTFGQMIRHVVNHGTYHRGQVTTLLRQVGAVPPVSTDLIAYYRDQSALLR